MGLPDFITADSTSEINVHALKRAIQNCLNYQAFVVDNQDPLRAGRLKLRVPHLFPGQSKVTDWTWGAAQTTGGAANRGHDWIPRIGDQVWVFLQNGDQDTLVWTNARKNIGSEKLQTIPDLNTLTRGGGLDPSRVPKLPPPAPDPSTQSPKGESIVVPLAAAGTKVEPAAEVKESGSPYATEYGYNEVFRSDHTVVEVDDTPGAPRLHIWHSDLEGGSSYLEIHPNGDWMLRAPANVFARMVGNLRLGVGGDLDFHVEGNMSLNVEGELKIRSGADAYYTTEGNRSDHTLGNAVEVMEGTHTWSTEGMATWNHAAEHHWTLADTAFWTFQNWIQTATGVVSSFIAWVINAPAEVNATWWHAVVHFDHAGRPNHDDD